MTVENASARVSWASGLVVAAVSHVVLLTVQFTTEVPPPVVTVDLSVSDMVRPPPPPPAPVVERPLTESPRPVVAKARETGATRAPKRTGDDAPPPPSNRAPDVNATDEPVEIVTGVNIPVLSMTGVAVRAGNTFVPGFEPKDPNARREVKGYRGGVIGGTAPLSGGTGEVGDGQGGGVRASQLTRSARILKRTRTRYPRELVRNEVDGTVVLRVEVLSTGAVGEVSVVKGAHPKLDEIAMDAVRTYVWAPGEVEGRPVTTTVRHTFRFEITD